jgi:hypothetical protein
MDEITKLITCLHCIFNQCETKDLFDIRLTCKLWNRVCIPHLYKQVKFVNYAYRTNKSIKLSIDDYLSLQINDLKKYAKHVDKITLENNFSKPIGLLFSNTFYSLTQLKFEHMLIWELPLIHCLLNLKKLLILEFNCVSIKQSPRLYSEEEFLPLYLPITVKILKVIRTSIDLYAPLTREFFSNMHHLKSLIFEASDKCFINSFTKTSPSLSHLSLSLTGERNDFELYNQVIQNNPQLTKLELPSNFFTLQILQLISRMNQLELINFDQPNGLFIDDVPAEFIPINSMQQLKHVSVQSIPFIEFNTLKHIVLNGSNLTNLHILVGEGLPELMHLIAMHCPKLIQLNFGLNLVEFNNFDLIDQRQLAVQRDQNVWRDDTSEPNLIELNKAVLSPFLSGSFGCQNSLKVLSMVNLHFLWIEPTILTCFKNLHTFNLIQALSYFETSKISEIEAILQAHCDDHWVGWELSSDFNLDCVFINLRKRKNLLSS